MNELTGWCNAEWELGTYLSAKWNAVASTINDNKFLSVLIAAALGLLFLFFTKQAGLSPLPPAPPPGDKPPTG